MSALPNFVTDADAFDVVIVARLQNPGIAKVTHAKKHEWDRKKGKGATGGTATYTGSNLQEFEIEYYLWLPEHFDAWPTFAQAQAKSTPVATSTTQTVTNTIATTGGNVNVQATTTSKVTKVTGTTAQPTALDIYHPSLAEPPYNITRCVVLEIGGKKPDGKGGATYTYKYSEYNPTKPAGGTANGSKDSAGSPAKDPEPTAKTQGERELADLLKKVNNP